MSVRRLLMVAVVLGMLAPAGAGASAAPVVPAPPCAHDVAGTTVAGPAPVGEEATPVGVGSCPGVRPGALVRSPIGTCTFNYRFDGVTYDGLGNAITTRYIGTGGHCILQQNGEQTWAAGTGPVARNAANQRIGEFAYAVLGGVRDFALIRIDAGVEANPQMCHFGGPTGINDDRASGLVELQHFGQGLALGSAIPARTAVANGMPDPDRVAANGAAVFGDSGSGINSADGRAVGVIVTIGVHWYGGVQTAGFMGITRLSPQLRRAEQSLGATLHLVTAPRL
jgi:hypothetical protein